MLKILLSPEQGFYTNTVNGVAKLSLNPHKGTMPKNPKVCQRSVYPKEGNRVERVYKLLTTGYYASHFTEEELGDMYYPLIVALRTYAFEIAGFRYHITDTMVYIAWNYYGQKYTPDFLDRTWLAYFTLKTYIDDVNMTIYSSILEPILCDSQSIWRLSDRPKYWGKTITKENELDFLDASKVVRDNENLPGTQGERLAAEYFKKCNIKYIYNQPVDYVCQHCHKQYLKPDFLLPEFDAVVEIHGPQHLEFNKGFHNTYGDFVEQQLRDIDMRNFCHEYGYCLIEVPYHGTEDVAMILARALKSMTNGRKRRKDNNND